MREKSIRSFILHVVTPFSFHLPLCLHRETQLFIFSLELFIYYILFFFSISRGSEPSCMDASRCRKNPKQQSGLK